MSLINYLKSFNINTYVSSNNIDWFNFIIQDGYTNVSVPNHINKDQLSCFIVRQYFVLFGNVNLLIRVLNNNSTFNFKIKFKPIKRDSFLYLKLKNEEIYYYYYYY